MEALYNRPEATRWARLGPGVISVETGAVSAYFVHKSYLLAGYSQVPTSAISNYLPLQGSDRESSRCPQSSTEPHGPTGFAATVWCRFCGCRGTQESREPFARRQASFCSCLLAEERP